MKKAGLAVLTASLLLVVSACSNDDDSDQSTSQEKTAITSMAASIAKPTDGLLSTSEAECVADKFVTDVGVDRLKAVKALDAAGAYVANGALVDTTTAASYTKAVLACVKEDTVRTKLVDTSEKGYAPQTAGLIPVGKVHCLITKFVATAGVEQMFASKFVTDTGAFAGPSDAYDEKTAEAFADALLGCVDYTRLQARLAAQADKKLSAAKLTTCLTRRTPTSQVRATLIARLTGSAEADSLLAASKAALVACEKVSKK